MSLFTVNDGLTVLSQCSTVTETGHGNISTFNLSYPSVMWDRDSSAYVTGPVGTACDHAVEPLGPDDGQASPAPQPGSTAVEVQGGTGDPAHKALVSTATTSRLLQTLRQSWINHTAWDRDRYRKQ